MLAALILAMNIYDDIGSTTLAPNSVMKKIKMLRCWSMFQ